MSGVTIVTQPAIEPVSGNQVRNHLKIEYDEDNDMIVSLIVAARQFVEDYTGTALMTQTLKLSLDGVSEYDVPLRDGLYVGKESYYQKRIIYLPHPPLVSVTHIKTFADDNTESTFAASNYHVDANGTPGRIVLKDGQNWPTNLRYPNGIEVTYVTGYSTQQDVPKPLQFAIMQYINYLYENRGEMGTDAPGGPPSVRGLLQGYRVMGFSNFPYALSRNF